MDNPFTLYAYDFLSGALLGNIPARTLQFGQQLNTPGQGTFIIDLYDPRVQAAAPLQCTIPSRTFVCVDYNGSLVWGGIVATRQWNVTGQQSATLNIQCNELWSYFQQRVQATDYSAPPANGIQDPMYLWTQTPWDASLIGCQVILDAIQYAQDVSVTNGSPLGGLGLMLNGSSPFGLNPAAPSNDWIAVTYPFTSTQTVDTIITQLSQLGVSVGFDFGVDVAYSTVSGSPPVATINVSYPRRGRSVSQNNLQVDLTAARAYSFPEDGTQTANQVYEVGGSGAIVVTQNVYPLDQGYPLYERVFSRANAQSQNIISLLGQTGYSDLALYSYPTVVPTVTLDLFGRNLPLGSFIVGDDVGLFIPQYAGDLTQTGALQVFDPRFPGGLDQDWRIVQWQATVPDQGDATLLLTLNQPPVITSVAPAI